MRYTTRFLFSFTIVSGVALGCWQKMCFDAYRHSQVVMSLESVGYDITYRDVGQPHERSYAWNKVVHEDLHLNSSSVLVDLDRVELHKSLTRHVSVDEPIINPLPTDHQKFWKWIGHLPRLQYLDLPSDLACIDSGIVKQLHELRWVNFSENPQALRLLQAFPVMPSVTHVDLAGCAVTKKSVTQICRVFPNLTNLALGISGERVSLSELAKHPTLQILAFTPTKNDRECPSLYLHDCKSLSQMFLIGVQVVEMSVCNCRRLERITAIRAGKYQNFSSHDCDVYKLTMDNVPGCNSVSVRVQIRVNI